MMKTTRTSNIDKGRLMMRHKAIIAAALAVFAGVVYAAQECTTQTFITDSGIIKTCSTCCRAAQCTTVCF